VYLNSGKNTAIDLDQAFCAARRPVSFQTDVACWHETDQSAGPEDVCSSGKIGSGRRIVKPTRMTDAVEKSLFRVEYENSKDR
jgi:hypothetical protein